MKKNFCKKISLTALLSIGLSLSCSSLPIPLSLPKNIGKNVNQIPFREVALTCNYWEDKNKNKRLDRGELKGIKGIFKEKENITIIREFINKKNKSYECHILDPKGLIRYFFEKDIDYDSCVTEVSFNASTLKEKYGIGLYTIKWIHKERLEKTHYFLIK